MNNYGMQSMQSISPVNCYQNSYQNNYQGQQSYYVDYQNSSNSQAYKQDYGLSSPVDINNQLNPNSTVWNSYYNGSTSMPIDDRTNMV